MVCLETDRLTVRDYRQSDFVSFHELVSCEKAMRYLPEVRCRDEQRSSESLHDAVASSILPDRSRYFFAVSDRTSDRLIGGIGFTIVRKGVGQLGYFYLPRYWGNGYATEAARTVLRYAFETLGMHKIVTGCLKENVGSERVMIKCRMRKEADLLQHVRHESLWKDRVEYGLLKADWIKHRSREEAAAT